MASSTSSDWEDNFNEIKTNHDAAYRKIDEALRLEEEGQPSRALRVYEEGLVLIDKALNVTVECPESPDFTWEKACSMLDKLKKTRKEVLIRVADSQVQRYPEFQVEPPPSYEEAISSPTYTPVQSPSGACSLSSMPSSGPSYSRSMSPHSLPLTYCELGEALRNLKVETGAQSAQVIYSVDNVRLYFISPNGTVSAPSQPNQLRILQLEDGGEQNVPKYYLQVGDWFYPLVPEVSPCFRSDFGAFILPYLYSSIEGAAVGIILPPEADESVYKFLDDVLHGVVTQTPVPPPRKAKPPKDISTSISRGLVTGAQYLSSGLVKGAEKASELISHSTPKLISKLEPESSPRHVPSSVRTGVKVARDVTGTAVNVTGYVAGKIGGATVALGRYLAPHIQRGGTKLLRKAGVAEDTAAEQVGGVLTVAAGAVEGFGTVYAGLEQSAKILGTSLADNTVQIVQHKYGEPMGEVTHHSLYTVGNVVLATNNVRNLTPKGIAKNTAKDAGRAVVEGLVEGHRTELQKWAKENNPDYHNDGTMNVGAVAALRRVKSAAKVARKVLEHTEHSILGGELATQFAVSMGFTEESLTTNESKQMWNDWKKNNCQPNYWAYVEPDPKSNCGPYKPVPVTKSFSRERELRNIDSRNHDTISMIAIDAGGKIAVGTSSNGARYKIPGRIGDAPIVGAGAYADNEVGAAVCTGDGDVMMRFLPSFLAVEEMRRGATPSQAGETAIRRIMKHYRTFSGAIIVASAKGEYAATCHGLKSFPYSLCNPTLGCMRMPEVPCVTS